MKKKKKTNSLYRSGLEQNIADQLKKEHIKFTYEQDKLIYTVPSKQATYIPDFKITTKSGKTIFIEGKGLWVYDDRYKHYLIRKSFPELDIRFVFTEPNTKIRKGSKTTYADICEGRGRGIFKDVCWKYAKKKIPTEWLEE